MSDDVKSIEIEMSIRAGHDFSLMLCNCYLNMYDGIASRLIQMSSKFISQCHLFHLHHVISLSTKFGETSSR